jgi:hypothetical protein
MNPLATKGDFAPHKSALTFIGMPLSISVYE